MIEKKSSDDLLKFMIEMLLVYIEARFPYKDVEGEQFQYGERVAYTECLEWLQKWEYAEINELDFDIEQRYPL